MSNDFDDEEEEGGVEYPAWSQPLVGWVYRIDHYEDGTVEIPDLPDFITITFNDDGSVSSSIDLDIISADTAEIEAEDIDELFIQLDELLSPLAVLFNPPPKKKRQ
jgi:hypothetical protein